MRDYYNSPGSKKYKTFIATYLAYRQIKRVILPKSVLRDFGDVQSEDGAIAAEPTQFNSTIFPRKLDLLNHTISYRDHSPDVPTCRLKMQAEKPSLWPK